MVERWLVRWVATALLVASAMLVAAAVGGQPLTLELSYSNPGARSMGFGGAFAALADDATAAFANPAGLSQLTRPEVSAEGRWWSYATPYTAGGRLEGVPSGVGLDTTLGLRTAVSHADVTGLSFLSFVYPIGDLSVALYRHQQATFEYSGQVNALFADEPAPEGADPGFLGVVRDQDVRGWLDFQSVSYGLAASYRLTEGLRLGVGVVFSDGSMLLRGEEYLPDDDSVESYFAAGSFLPERLSRRDTVSIDDTDWTFSAGLLWSPGPRWRVAGFYRQGPGFGLRVESAAGPADPFVDAGVLRSAVALPDVYGVGLAFRSAGGRLTLAFEWDRVEYSALLDSLDPAIRNPQLVLDDGSELHLGAEYVFLDSTPVIALRLGAWLDPDHRNRYTGDEPFARALFRGGGDEIHYAVGFGLAFERFQVDLAVDLSELRDTASVSAILGF